MNQGIEFLLGLPNPSGLTVKWVLEASDAELEGRHDWVQWAFPTDQPSQFIWNAPVVTLKEMQGLDHLSKGNLRKMTVRFCEFLAQTEHWRHPGDHNHLRITRALRCLTLAGMNGIADAMFQNVTHIGNPSPESLAYWASARDLSPQERS